MDKNFSLQKILLAIFCSISLNYMAFAQNVGINANGATPADCSMLDIVSTTKGLLIPRVALTDVTVWSPLTGTAVDGVIVYSTANPTGGSGTGYYYWSTVATAHWVNLLDNLNPGTPWLTIGNTGLTSPAAPATYGTSLIASTENWMGHTDAKDIVFGTDTKERMRIMKTSGFVGIGTAAPSTLLHINGGTGSTTQTITTITGNSLTTGKGLLISSSSLTSGNLVEIQANNATSNATYTSSGLYVKNDAPYGNAIQAVSGGLPNYSSIFADETPAGAGSGYSISLSNHAIAGQVNGNQAYSFGVYGRVVSAPSPSGGVIGYYAADDYGALGYWDGTYKNGGFFNGLDRGIYATSTSIGVYGLGDATASSWGVYGKSIAAGGLGVYGRATINDGDGVDGDNTAAAGAGTGFGGYFTTLQTGGCALGGSLGGYFYYSGTGTSGITNYASGFGVAGNNSAAAGIGVIGFGNNTSTYWNPNSAGAGGTFSGTRYGLVAGETNETTVGAGYYYGNTYAGIHTLTQTNAASTGTYHFSIHGAHSDYGASYGYRTGGVLGSMQWGGTNKSWASLGYENSAGTTYGVYGTVAAANGAGFLPNGTITDIGLGGYGGVMGGWIRGEVMGFVSSGELFASYNLGNTYTSGYQAEIVTLAEKRIATYSVTSTEVKVYNDGIGQLSMGKTRINFESSFSELIADSRPVVTITPMGQCNGIYISNIDSKGFDVVELNNGSSNVEFSYIVISKRIDAVNKPELPQALAKKDFDEKMKGVMFNESNLEQSALPVWWDGKQIRFEAAPEKQASNVIKAEVRKPEEKKNRKPNKD